MDCSCSCSACKAAGASPLHHESTWPPDKGEVSELVRFLDWQVSVADGGRHGGGFWAVASVFDAVLASEQWTNSELGAAVQEALAVQVRAESDGHEETAIPVFARQRLRVHEAAVAPGAAVAVLNG